VCVCVSVCLSVLAAIGWIVMKFDILFFENLSWKFKFH